MIFLFLFLLISITNKVIFKDNYLFYIYLKKLANKLIMWEKLNNSSLLFSKNFYLSDESNFYMKTGFINKLYFYYCQKGYYNIISTQMVNLLISNFMILFIMFLVNCVDFIGILTLNNNEHLGEYIHWNQFFRMNYFMWSLFIVFLIFTGVRILNLIDDIISYRNIRLYYKTTLKIRDCDLEYLEWNNIIETLNEEII